MVPLFCLLRVGACLTESLIFLPGLYSYGVIYSSEVVRFISQGYLSSVVYSVGWPSMIGPVRMYPSIPLVLGPERTVDGLGRSRNIENDDRQPDSRDHLLYPL